MSNLVGGLTAQGGKLVSGATVQGNDQLNRLMQQYPEVRDAWTQHVLPQINAEGIVGGQLSTIQQSFVNELVGGPAGNAGLLFQYGMHAITASDAAAQYVTMAHTAYGAVSQIEGLVDAMQGGAQAAPQVIQTSMGLMVGLMGALAPSTLGIGSAIVAAVGAIMTLLGNAGLFGKPPPGFSVPYCNPTPWGININWNSQPSSIIGCVGRFGGPIASATLSTGATNTSWLRFPVKQGDLIVAGDSPVSAFDTVMPSKISWPGTTGLRKIDLAFPGGQGNGQRGPANDPTPLAFELPYSAIEVLQASSASGGFRISNLFGGGIGRAPQNLIDFNTAFVSAWKANAEQALNGQRASHDYTVLAQVATAFNRAHDSVGSGDIVVAPWKAGLGWQWSSEARPIVGCLLPDMINAGLGTAVRDSFGNKIPDAFIAADGVSLLIHGGPRKQKVASPGTVIALNGLVGKLGAFGAAQKAGGVKPSAESKAAADHLKSLGYTKIAVPSAFQKDVHLAWPLMPAAIGAASFPLTGVVGPVLGAAGTAAWYALRKHG